MFISNEAKEVTSGPPIRYYLSNIFIFLEKSIEVGMLTCYVVDDERHALERICDYVQQTAGLKLIGSATDSITASGFLSKTAPDILFTDIEMPHMTGLELAQVAGKNCAVIFTTAHVDFALEAFDSNGLAYLLKPVPYAKFLKAINRVIELKKQATKEEEYLFIRGDVKGKMHRVELKEIIYLESAQNYVNITLENGSVTTYMMISEMAKVLPENQFSRVHRSFIINHQKISYLTANQAVMKDGTHVPLSESYKAAFLNKIQPRTLISERLSP